MKNSVSLPYFPIATAVSIALSFIPSDVLAASIGINFTGGAHLLSSTDSPGIIFANNWNNVIGATGTNIVLNNDSGTQTSARLTFNSLQAFDAYSGLNTSNLATNTLYRGGLVGTNVGPGEISINISSVPYAQYDLYVYASADTTATNTLSLSLNNGFRIAYYAGNGTFNSGARTLLRTTSGVSTVPTRGPGQYQLFSNLTGSSISLRTGGSIDSVLSNNIFGLQIVENTSNTSPTGLLPTNPFLPIASGRPFRFRFVVGPGGLGRLVPVFVDPIVAIGYDYEVSGGPLFESVLIPDALPNGDSDFSIEYGNIVEPIVAGSQYFFPTGGIDKFRITGINVDEGLNPDDPLAFVTGLTFTGDGEVTVTQNPLTETVPEPSPIVSLAFLGLGLTFVRRKSA